MQYQDLPIQLCLLYIILEWFLQISNQSNMRWYINEYLVFWQCMSEHLLHHISKHESVKSSDFHLCQAPKSHTHHYHQQYNPTHIETPSCLMKTIWFLNHILLEDTFRKLYMNIFQVQRYKMLIGMMLGLVHLHLNPAKYICFVMHLRRMNCWDHSLSKDLHQSWYQWHSHSCQHFRTNTDFQYSCWDVAFWSLQVSADISP